MIHGPLIKTKFLGPTTYRGARITASHHRDSERTWRKTIDWDHSVDAFENARMAALALIRSIDWEVQIVASAFDHDHYWFVVSPAPITPV